MKGLVQLKAITKRFEDLGADADKLARGFGKLAEIKRPLQNQFIHLTLRNIDSNSRDEAGSVNSIQAAMDIAVLAASYGMASTCFKAQGELHLQISPIEEKKE